MKSLIKSIKIFVFFTVLTGIIYPLLVTGIAKFVFPTQANGSLVHVGNKVVGSELIGQQFDNPKYFSSRPSACTYDAMASGGSNLGPTSIKLKKIAEDRRSQFLSNNGLTESTVVPSEMLYASASGLDPHISVQAALMQVDRIAKVRMLKDSQKQRLKMLIQSLIEKPQLGFLGNERINVLQLNVKLDKMK
jgi:potassium-transporting ATPase KdpC subunit